MKVRFYLDIHNNRKPGDFLTATTSPGPKGNGVKRVQFDVTIPDRILDRVDEEVLVEEDAEEWIPNATAKP